jgi:hypothetical protein
VDKEVEVVYTVAHHYGVLDVSKLSAPVAVTLGWLPVHLQTIPAHKPCALLVRLVWRQCFMLRRHLKKRLQQVIKLQNTVCMCLIKSWSDAADAGAVLICVVFKIKKIKFLKTGIVKQGHCLWMFRLFMMYSVFCVACLILVRSPYILGFNVHTSRLPFYTNRPLAVIVASCGDAAVGCARGR